MKRPTIRYAHRDSRTPIRLNFSGLKYNLVGLAAQRLFLAMLCLDHKDITEDLVSRAEAAADARLDR